MGRHPGAGVDLRRTVPAPTGLDLDVVGVPPGTLIALDLRLESVTEGVLVTGTVTALIVGECARCLDPVSDAVVVELCELYAYPESATDETTDDEVPRLVDDRIDLTSAVRDAVVLALPVAPLCRPDCPGLCAVCGERLADLGPGHSHHVLDPRWAALTGKSERQGADKTD